MPYFTYFPSIAYTVDPEDLTKVISVKDITVRAKISDYFKNSALTSLPYEIQDGERPETLAHRVYDRSDLFWVILLFNEIHDSTFEWPLSSAELESHLESKYRGYALFYPDSARIPDAFQEQDTSILQGATTISQTLANGTTITANILSWDPTYNRIVVDGEQASMFDVNLDSPFSTDNFARVFVDGDPSKLLAVTRFMPYQYAVHHFEDSEGIVLNPRSGPPSDINNPSSLLDRYVKYDPDPNNTSSVEVANLTVENRAYEFKVNDSKRLIRMIKPDYMSTIVTQFRSLFE